MYIIPDSIISDPWKLGVYIEMHEITRLFVTSSVLELLLDILENDISQYLKSLRCVSVSDESVLSVRDIAQLYTAYLSYIY